MSIESLLWLIPALPLLGFLVNGTVGKRLPAPAVGAIAVAGPAVAFVLSVLAFLGLGGGHGDHGAPQLHQVVWSWIATGDLSVDFGLLVDPLSAVMLLNVTGIGTAIHLYSYGYMHEDSGFARFMSYLNLFLASMLILVLGDSLLLLFVGWEGVGLCSYLLIGFWFKDFANVDAGRKAFVVNRVGDLAFLIGTFILFSIAGGVDFATLEGSISHLDRAMVLTSGPLAGYTVQGALTAAGLALFFGATGKSAQIPLYIWLPDAMAGPTPVSALIHAATMVTAGIYLIGRLDFVYADLPDVGLVVAVVAAATAMLSGIIAVAQNDIKKVLAYSTVSQLGFMFAGMATTMWTAGLFHVLTHAFFKALLFLGAGAVIVAMHHEQDIRKMGGLAKDLKGVFVLFLIGSLALAGVPPFAGFFSKDEILGAVHLQMTMNGGLWALVFFTLVATAALTAFYTTRLVVLTFFGAPYVPSAADAHAHDAHGHDSHDAHGHDAHAHDAHGHDAHSHDAHGHDAHGHADDAHDDDAHAHAHHGPVFVDGKRQLAPVHWTMMVVLVFLAILSVGGGLLATPLHDFTHSAWTEASWHHGGHGEHALTAEAIHEMEHHSHQIAMMFSVAAVVLGIGAGLAAYGPGRAALGGLVEGPLRPLHTFVSGKLYVDELYELVVVKPVGLLSRVLFTSVDRAVIDGALVEGSGQSVLGAADTLRRTQAGAVSLATGGTLVGAAAILLWLIASS
jgi:NADH-quinone oxidoreductase subunit L